MKYQLQELDKLTLQQLAKVYYNSSEEEEAVRLAFAEKARKTHLANLRNIDVREKWQEAIIQECVLERRNEEPQDNAPVLSSREAALLDSSNLYADHDAEVRLQKLLDERRGISSEVEESEPLPDPTVGDVVPLIEETQEETVEGKKRGRPAKS